MRNSLIYIPEPETQYLSVSGMLRRKDQFYFILDIPDSEPTQNLFRSHQISTKQRVCFVEIEESRNRIFIIIISSCLRDEHYHLACVMV